jgi:RNA polymerase primary sigma factor
VQQRESLKVLWDWLQKLRPREREIVSLRYGLGGEEPKTLEEIGSLHGVTRERIRQIEMGALRKLRRMAAEECVQFNWLY